MDIVTKSINIYSILILIGLGKFPMSKYAFFKYQIIKLFAITFKKFRRLITFLEQKNENLNSNCYSLLTMKVRYVTRA